MKIVLKNIYIRSEKSTPFKRVESILIQAEDVQEKIPLLDSYF